MKGKVVNSETGKPVEFASVLIPELSLWAIADENGDFHINGISKGKYAITIQSMGYEKYTASFTSESDIKAFSVRLTPTSLKLDDVTVVAQRRKDETSTSYNIDRMTLDNQQIIDLSNLTSLLPGGKTRNENLTNDNKLALRSGSSEKGNAAFGTAIEIDGVRIDNNAVMNETSSASTRNISTANIESVDIITGIPSVEYGDLSNGIVKVNMRHGKSPFIVEGKLNEVTQQYSISKGFDFGKKRGLLNISLEHAKSYTLAVSPYTAYQRNVMSVRYQNIFMQKSKPLTFTAGFTGNIGGYDSKQDPDNILDNYTKTRDNLYLLHTELKWLLNMPWITNVSLKSSFVIQDKLSENYANANSSSAQPYIHVTENGYHVAQDYTSAENAQNSIVMGPTGYWYVKGYNDQKPTTFNLNLKANWVKRFGNMISNITVGADYKASGNNGRGNYYEDMKYAPTWRPYRYDELPWMHSLGLYAEEKFTVPVCKGQSLLFTAGIRDDMTKIDKSEYDGTKSAFAPRFNIKYTWNNADKDAVVSTFTVHAGWGRSVKLPSFQVLYPSPTYTDVLAFTPGSTADNKAFYAYYTNVSKPLYNSNLKWQSTDQLDLGFETTVFGTHISLSAFYHRTRNPYSAIYNYTPYSYSITSQNALESCQIPVSDRLYSIDRTSGIVTVSDKTGTIVPVTLDYTTQRTYQQSTMFVNGSSVDRYGLEWIVDFTPIRPINTQLRLDGNMYQYKGLDQTLFAGGLSGQGELLAYYRGSSSTSTSAVSSASLSNGRINRQVNLNATLTTRIPKIRLIMMLRMECSLYDYSRPLSEIDGGSRGVVLENANDFFGTPYDGTSRDKYVAIYPEYYATWDNPTELIPFEEKFKWARENDQQLYNNLSRLVIKSNYAYMMNPEDRSFYYSLNFSATKEIGNHISVSFYANNFLNNMSLVKSGRTGQESSLFNSGLIQKFYYGLSVKFKI